MPYWTRQRGGDRRSGKTYGPNYLVYTPFCAVCGTSFPAARPDARYCSPAHRQLAHRTKKVIASLHASQLAAEERARKQSAREKKKRKKKTKKTR